MTGSYDLVVIGAGWFGLSSAKAYLDLHPDLSILVVEAGSSFGGTWSEDRLYPGLKSNNVISSYEHPDLPMSEATYGVRPGQHIPGPVLHRYLSDFAARFGIVERTRFNTRVESVEPSGRAGGWKLVTSSKTGAEEVLETKKLIVACGLTSQPNIPTYPGIERFTVPFFHAKDFCAQSRIIDTARNAVVVGGAKSAYDVAYAFAGQGSATVDLIIRQDGQGPVWLCPTYIKSLRRMTDELLHTRVFTWFSPCPWGGEDGFGGVRNFLHGTRVGRWIVDKFWSALGNGIIRLNRYDKHPLARRLKPWNSVLWSGSGISIHNYDTNFFDLVNSGKIRVHITDVVRLDGNTVFLETGEKIETDVVVCATGWKKDPSFRFLDLGDAGLGLPYTAQEKSILNKQADEEILTMFPALRDQPILRSKAKAAPRATRSGSTASSFPQAWSQTAGSRLRECSRPRARPSLRYCKASGSLPTLTGSWTGWRRTTKRSRGR